MATPSVPLTSPWAPPPGRLQDAFQIADMMRDTGRLSAQARGARRLAVADLIGGIGGTVADVLQQRSQRAAAEQRRQLVVDLAGRYARGEAIDPMETLRALGGDISAAKQVIELAESFKPKTGEDYTLRPGEARYRGTQQIASVPAAPDPAAQARAAQVAKDAADQQALQEAMTALEALAPDDAAGQLQVRRTYTSKTGKALPDSVFAPKPTLRTVTAPGPNGPVERSVTEAELKTGVPVYRAPTAAPSGPDQEWVLRDGSSTPIPIPKGTAIPGRDVPYNRQIARKNVTAGDAEALADFNTALDDVTVLRDTIAPLDPATGLPKDIGATGYLAAAKAWMPTLGLGIGAEEKARQAVIDRVKQVIGKTLEGGVLRKEDEAKYERILPTIKDDALVVRSKLTGLEQAIRQRKRRRLDALADADYDTSRFEERERQAPPAAGGGRPAPDAAAASEARDAAAALKGRAPGQTYTLQDDQGRTSRWLLMPNGTALKLN